MKVASNIDSERNACIRLKKMREEREIGVGCIMNVHCEGNGRECRIREEVKPMRLYHSIAIKSKRAREGKWKMRKQV